MGLGAHHMISALTRHAQFGRRISHLRGADLSQSKLPAQKISAEFCIECCKFYVRGIKTPTISGIDYLPLVTNG